MLQRLGIADEVATRLRVFPNGATAMRQLAQSDAKRPIGCTQSTEIITTQGVELSGTLPAGCDLATMYTAGITVHAVNANPARLLIDLMTSADSEALRSQAGFLSTGR